MKALGMSLETGNVYQVNKLVGDVASGLFTSSLSVALLNAQVVG